MVDIELASSVVALTRELDEALKHQAATSEVLRSLNRSAIDLDAVLQTLVNSAAKLCDATRCTIWLPEGDNLVARASVPSDPESLAFLRTRIFPIDMESHVGRAMLTATTAHVEDSLTDPIARHSATNHQHGRRTFLAVPLLRGDTAIGVFFLARPVEAKFSDRHVSMIESFADQAVIAIENVNLIQKLKKRTQELDESLRQQTATAHVLEIVSRSAFDLQFVLDALIKSAVELCGGVRGTIWMRGEDGLYRMTAQYNLSEEQVAAFRENPVAPSQDLLVPRVALTGETVHIPDTTLVDNGNFTSVVSRAHFAVPMMRGDRVEGVFAVGRDEPGSFSEPQIDLLTIFSDRALIAVENSRLLEEVTARTRELTESLEYQKAISNVLGAISGSPSDVDPVSDIIAATAMELCLAVDATVLLRERDALRVSAYCGGLMFDRQMLPLNRDYVAGRCVLDGDSVQCADLLAAGQDYPLGIELARNMGFRTAMAVPLMREGEAIGCILVRRNHVETFTPRQLGLLRTLADQAVIAIRNVQLFEDVNARTRELSNSLDELRAAQDRLVQTEKLASLGQLTAGIAHEIKNPLNFVNNFAEISRDLVDEIDAGLKGTLEPHSRAELIETSGLLRANLEKIAAHGKRADSIVRNMLSHSRDGGSEHRPVDLNAAVEEAIALAYHGARAANPDFNVTLSRDYDPNAGVVDIFTQEFHRVLINLASNGFYAMTKGKSEGKDPNFEPELRVSTKDRGAFVEITIRDNGPGIPDAIRARVFEPFFTTKPAGEGTGLGLSISYDIIVKQHNGRIGVESGPGGFTEFSIVLPRTFTKSSESK